MLPTLQDLEQTRAAWDRIAAGYDELVSPTHLEVATESLRQAGLRPEMHMLDVAAGSGALSLPAARLGARVLATDISPVMIERLTTRARGEGLANLEGRVMDGHALELDDNTFDLAGSQFGVMVFPDMPRGIRELARVTKPGGRVLMTVYGPPTQVEFFAFFIAALQAAVPGFTGPPMDPPPLPFQLRDPAKLRHELATAGLHEIQIVTTAEQLEFQSADHMWDWLVHSNPVGAKLVADLTEEQSVAVRQALDDLLRKRAGGSGPAVLTNPVHIGVGTK